MADLLKRFRDAGIPILWRPLHEADGAWFWWGAYGAQACVKLYRLMYDRFVNLHKLNNLIWIWNSVSPDWYPGDDCVDIISRDVYAKNDGALKAEFEDVKKLNPDKIVALAECGIAPDPEKMKAKEAMWAWYMVWCGGFVMDDKGNSREQLKAIYESPLTVALDDLPWNRK